MTSNLLRICLIASWLAAVAGPAFAGEDFAPLAARYLESRGDGHAPARPVEWYLTRKGNQVEISRTGYVDLWERDERGEVSWQRIFHDDQKVIVYTPGELTAQNRALSWEAVNSVIDIRQLLTTLQPVGTTTYLDRPATRYVGRFGNEEIDLVWLDAEQLPGRMRRRGVHIDDSLALQELLPAPASTWPQSDPSRTRDYEQIDGSDLGDREYDPFVRKVQAMDGHTHAH